MQHPHKRQEGVLYSKSKRKGIWGGRVVVGRDMLSSESEEQKLGEGVIVQLFAQLSLWQCQVTYMFTWVGTDIIWVGTIVGWVGVTMYYLFLCLILCNTFLAFGIMGQILHKTLWCLVHLFLFLLSLMSASFGIIKCTVSINGSFFLSTGLGGEGRGMQLQALHQTQAVGLYPHLHTGYKKGNF